MADELSGEPKQPTQPKKGEPIQIPIPEKRDVMDFLENVARTPDPDRRRDGSDN